MTEARFARRDAFSHRQRSIRMSVRARLRAATAATHERMHAHPGFGAAAAGVIDASDYRRLLARLYGFHRRFEDVARLGAEIFEVGFNVDARARSPWLELDLKALGVDQATIFSFPLWSSPISLTGKGSLLGAFYVVEGSTLGGIQIARALEGRIGGELGAGRRFFLGRGARHGAMWGEFLEELETLSEDDRETEQAIDAALATFEGFEAWMAGWRTAVGGSK